MSSYSPPKLPVYLILDTSSAVAGSRFAALQTGLLQLFQHVVPMADDPDTPGLVLVGLIAYGGDARMVTPLTPVSVWRQSPLPAIHPGGARPLGAALYRLIEAREREVRPPSGDFVGDFKPLVFLLAAGLPDDDWSTMAQEVKNRSAAGHLNVLAIALDEVTRLPGLLAQVTSSVLALQHDTPKAMGELFHWIAACINAARSAAASAGKGGVSLPAPPAVLQFVGAR